LALYCLTAYRFTLNTYNKRYIALCVGDFPVVFYRLVCNFSDRACTGTINFEDCIISNFLYDNYVAG